MYPGLYLIQVVSLYPGFYILQVLALYPGLYLLLVVYLYLGFFILQVLSLYSGFYFLQVLSLYPGFYICSKFYPCTLGSIHNVGKIEDGTYILLYTLIYPTLRMGTVPITDECFKKPVNSVKNLKKKRKDIS